MRDMGIVQGDLESAKSVSFGPDTVFVRLNIREVDTPSLEDDGEPERFFEWEEHQIGLHRWVAELTKRIVVLDSFAPVEETDVEELGASIGSDDDKLPFTFKTIFD